MMPLAHFPAEVKAFGLHFEDTSKVTNISHHASEQKLIMSMGAFANHCAAGRQVAHHALKALGAKDAPLLRDEHRAPLWPEGVMGSISHTEGLAIACAAEAKSYSGMGIDTEHHSRTFSFFRARLFASPCEEQWLKSDEAASLFADPRVLLLSAKECIYKCMYQHSKVRLGFHQAELNLEHSDAERVTFSAKVEGLERPLKIHSHLFGEYFISHTLLAA